MVIAECSGLWFISAGEQMGSVTYQVVQQNLETWLLRQRAGGLEAGAD